MSAPDSLLRWTLAFLRPHGRRVALLSVLLLLEVGLGALQPWPLKIVIDHVLSSDRQPVPEPFRSWLPAVPQPKPAPSIARSSVA